MRLLALLVLVLFINPALAQSMRGVRLNAANANRPVLVTQPPGETARLFVVEQPGTIRILNASTGAINATPFLTVPAVNYAGETGLLGMAFHPEYASNGYFYLYYNRSTASGSPAARTIVRYRVSSTDPNIADPASATVIWAHLVGASIHNGGWIAFGRDRNLYIAWGEHGTGSNASDITDNPLGKIHRIDVNGPDGVPGTADDDGFPADDNKNYRIPATNPFVGIEGDDEIWLYGLRNPWRNSFDRATGELYIADVGQGVWEEVNVVPANPTGSRNYGWPCMEGFFCTGSQTNTSCACNNASLMKPAYAYLNTGAGGCAISGGYVYRGCAMPWLNGLYFFGDYCAGKVWSGRYNGTILTDVTDRSAEFWPAGLRTQILSFGEDALGELYVCAGNGGIYKMVPPLGMSSQCQCGTADFNGDGDYGTDADIEAFFACLAGNCCSTCFGGGSDFNGDGDTGTDGDIEAFFRVLAGGYC